MAQKIRPSRDVAPALEEGRRPVRVHLLEVRGREAGVEAREAEARLHLRGEGGQRRGGHDDEVHALGAVVAPVEGPHHLDGAVPERHVVPGVEP